MDMNEIIFEKIKRAESSIQKKFHNRAVIKVRTRLQLGDV